MDWYEQKENIIREHRTAEANKKKYMGPSGKLSVIARILGEPIYRQGSPLYNFKPMPDVWNMPEEGGIPYLDEEEISYIIGYNFDGLKHGVNLVIDYLDKNNEVTAKYDGKIVYCELAAVLERFSPHESWEKYVDSFYSKAIKIYKERKQNKKKDEQEAKKKSQFLKNLRDKWGI